MKFFLNIFSLALCLLAGHAAAAQKKSAFVRHLTTSEGLSNDICHTILKDSKGYVWMGTENGLNRYDGHKFQVFKNIPGDSSSIGGNTVMELHEDKKGNIWISGIGFLNKYNLQDHKFTHYQSNEADSSMHLGGYVESFYTDTQNRTWLCIAGGGVELYSEENNHFRRLHPGGKAGAFPENFVSGMCESPDGRFWLSTHNGLFEMSSDFQRFKQHLSPPPRPDENVFYNLCTCVMLDPLDPAIVWYGTWGTGLHRYNTITGVTDIFTFRNNMPMNISNIVFDMKADADHNIWITSEYGLAQFDRVSGKFIFIDDDIKNPHALRLAESHNLFIDNENMLWASGYYGANILDPHLQSFTSLTYGEGASLDNLSFDSYHNCFIGTTVYRNRSLNIYNIKTGKIENIPMPFAEEGRNEPFGLYADSKGKYWLGFVRLNIRTYSPEEKQFTEIPLDKYLNTSQSHLDVRSFAEDQNGRMWMAALSLGVLLYEPDGKTIKLVTDSTLDLSRGMTELRQDENYIYAFGVNYGVIRINKHTLQTEMGDFRKIDMLQNAVGFEITDNGQILITTNSHGLIECSFGTQGFEILHVIDTNIGFPENNLGPIVRYAPNEYWISCASGLIVYRADGISRIYSENNGLYPYMPGARLLIASDHRIYYTMGDRLVSFYPPDLASASGEYRVVLNSFRVDEKEVYSPDVLGDLQHIQLSAGQNSFAFEYSALCYSNVNQLEYAFILNGAEEDWHYVGNRLYASYSNLDPGEYELRIKTRMAENKWPDQYTSLKITIAPHWWQTWFFRIGIILLLVVITISAIRIYTRNKLRKVELELEKQKSIQQIRTRISRDIHDEIGAGLTKISLMSRKVVRESDEESAIAETAKNIAGASQQLVKNLGEIVWTINPKNDTLADFLGYVRSYCTALFDDSEIRLYLQISEISQEARGWKLYPEVKRNLLLIIKETLNNAIKHSGAQEVKLSIDLSEHILEVIIQDNGSGFDPGARAEAGNGLRNMKKRSEEIGAVYTLHSTPSGTRTCVRLGLNENLL